MIDLLLAALFILTTYTTYAIKVCGVPWSLSDTYYQLKKHGRPAWLFQLTMVSTAFLLMPVCLEISKESTQFLAFFACGSLGFVGAAPLFKEDLQKQVHYGAAAVAAVCACLWLLLTPYWYIPLIGLALAVGIALKYQKWVFWLEMGVIGAMVVGVIIMLLN